MLHHRREVERQFAEREARGEDVWLTQVSDTAQRRIGTVLELTMNPAIPEATRWRISEQVQTIFKLRLGIDLGWAGAVDPWATLLRALTHYDGDQALYPSILEATFAATESQHGDSLAPLEAPINDILGEERIAVRLVEGRMIPFDSMELHTAVVEPAIRLLHRAEYTAVEDAFNKALHEITTDPSDAITDAGTALQEMLEALGCAGNKLGTLIKDAKAKGILAPHDATLGDGISKILDWVSADRSEKGDGHHASSATEDDAWFAVHVVGAVILRLAAGTGRGKK